MAEDFELARLIAVLEAEGVGIDSSPLPAPLPLTTIHTLPKLFQVREMSPYHIDDLARALREGATVPPLTVLRTGRRVIVVDGHHRLEAHHKAGMVEAPVVTFRGTVREAVLEACAANSITKLPMTATERQDAAWRYVRLGAHSKAQIAKVTGCSARTVATMRAVLKRLDLDAYSVETWGRAMSLDRVGRREEQTEEEREEWLESTAQRYADLMARTFSGKLTVNPEIAARALVIHLGRRLGPVMAHLQDWLPDSADSDY